jgi:hypothetical protein
MQNSSNSAKKHKSAITDVQVTTQIKRNNNKVAAFFPFLFFNNNF